MQQVIGMTTNLTSIPDEQTNFYLHTIVTGKGKRKIKMLFK